MAANNVNKKELIIPADTAFLVHDYEKHIEQMFDVKLGYGLMSHVDEGKDKVSHQWIEVSGTDKNCKEAMNYLKSLTTPSETVTMAYPPEVHDALIDPKQHCRLEKESKAAILFVEGGELLIKGCDSLSVTLALSAVEDLLNKLLQKDEVSDLNEAESMHEEWDRGYDSTFVSPTRQSSLQLDEELHRISGGDGDFIIGQDTSTMSDAVKRSFLIGFREDKEEKKSRNSTAAYDSDTTIPKVPEETMRMINNMQSASLNKMDNFVDLHSMDISKDTTSKQSVTSITEKIAQADISENTSIPNDPITVLALEQGYDLSEIQKARIELGSDITLNNLFKVLLEKRMASKEEMKKKLIPPDSFKAKPDVIDLTSSPRGEPSSPQLHPDLISHSMDLSENQVKNASARKKKHHQEYLDEYLMQRSQDEAEEHSSMSKEELKERSAIRQRILQQALESKREAEVVTISSGSEDSDADIAVLNLDERQDEPMNNDHMAENIRMDALDDFSLPYVNVTKQNKKSHRIPEVNMPKQGIKALQQEESHSKKRPKNRSPNAYSASNTPQKTKKNTSPKAKKRHEGNQMDTFQDMQATGGQAAFNNLIPQALKQPTAGPSHKRLLRYIVIDGSNIAMEHGNHKVFSCRGLKIVIDYFLSRGHREITTFVPQWRQRRPTDKTPISDQHLLEELRDQGYLVYTPARRLRDGTNIVSYDDRFIVRLAHQQDGIIVTNDQYRDLHDEEPEWREVIENRLLPCRFVGDFFMPADDPLGKDGPRLDEFLSKPDPNSNQKRQGLLGHFPGDNSSRLNQASHLSAVTSNNSNLTWQQRDDLNRQFSRNEITSKKHRQNEQQPEPSNSKKMRPQTESNDLFFKLQSIFPQDRELVLKVLQKHPAETDLNKLSSYILELQA